MNDLYKYNLITYHWTKINCEGRGPIPSKRYFHNAVNFTSTSILIIGGYNGVVRLNDIYAFDTEKEQWSIIKSEGEQIEGRSSFVAGCWRGHYCFPQ